ncbi:hypothetical protein ACWJJH_09400 [Endozoicomonadaceae bacterium StTr2]
MKISKPVIFFCFFCLLAEYTYAEIFLTLRHSDTQASVTGIESTAQPHIDHREKETLLEEPDWAKLKNCQNDHFEREAEYQATSRYYYDASKNDVVDLANISLSPELKNKTSLIDSVEYPCQPYAIISDSGWRCYLKCCPLGSDGAASSSTSSSATATATTDTDSHIVTLQTRHGNYEFDAAKYDRGCQCPVCYRMNYLGHNSKCSCCGFRTCDRCLIGAFNAGSDPGLKCPVCRDTSIEFPSKDMDFSTNVVAKVQLTCKDCGWQGCYQNKDLHSCKDKVWCQVCKKHVRAGENHFRSYQRHLDRCYTKCPYCFNPYLYSFSPLLEHIREHCRFSNHFCMNCGKRRNRHQACKPVDLPAVFADFKPLNAGLFQSQTNKNNFVWVIAKQLLTLLINHDEIVIGSQWIQIEPHVFVQLFFDLEFSAYDEVTLNGTLYFMNKEYIPDVKYPESGQITFNIYQGNASNPLMVAQQVMSAGTYKNIEQTDAVKSTCYWKLAEKQIPTVTGETEIESLIMEMDLGCLQLLTVDTQDPG